MLKSLEFLFLLPCCLESLYVALDGTIHPSPLLDRWIYPKRPTHMTARLSVSSVDVQDPDFTTFEGCRRPSLAATAFHVFLSKDRPAHASTRRGNGNIPDFDLG
jgi:hypothetical protein